MRSDGSEEITLGLIGDHFQEIGEVFTFWSQLQNRLAGQVLEWNPPVSPGESKPATDGRFKTSHSEVGSFISVGID